MSEKETALFTRFLLLGLGLILLAVVLWRIF